MANPTGLGLTKGIESADLPGGSTFNRQAYARSNDAKYSKLDQQPDPCYCGCCDMTRKAVK